MQRMPGTSRMNNDAGYPNLFKTKKSDLRGGRLGLAEKLSWLAC